MNRPDESIPPPALVPLPPAEVSSNSVHGWYVRAIFDSGSGGAEGHTYLVDVTLAAIANDRVGDALADATLAGLCTRCSSVHDIEVLLTRHVLDAILDEASGLFWTHASLIDEHCAACARTLEQASEK